MVDTSTESVYNYNINKGTYSMRINDIQARKILLSLYNVAEKDKSDLVANAASALAVRLETAKREYNLTDLEKRIVKYALTNQPVAQIDTTNRRKTYKRRVSLA